MKLSHPLPISAETELTRSRLRVVYSSVVGRLIEFVVARVLARIFPGRWRVVPRIEDGAPLLRQFRILGSGSNGSGVYLQSFVNAESAVRFHRHRWCYMRSFVLSGALVEERYPGEIYLVHEAPTTYTMDRGVIHRAEWAEPRTWTLFVMLGKGGRFGYYDRPERAPEFTPWEKAIPNERRVRVL